MKLLKVLDYPALLILGRKRVLVVADLHIGIGGFFDKSLLVELKRLYFNCGADELVIAGDFKHSIVSKKEAEVLEMLKKDVELVLVKGNHDGNLDGLREYEVGNVCIIHGHLKPVSSKKNLVMGHAHPAVFIDKGIKERVWLEGSAEINDKRREITVLPAFNDVCASTALNVEKAPGILRKINLSNFKATMLDGTFLGELCTL